MATPVRSLMPQLQDELSTLVGIASVSAPGFPEQARGPILEAHDAIAGLFGDAGVDVEALELPDTAPVITGGIPAPDGAPTVLLYSHYDVVPAGDESAWESPPFEPTERDGAIFGRGSADTKSNVLSLLGAIRAWDGRPPVGVKLCIEGQEEVGSALTTYPLENAEPFEADAAVIADLGSIRPGEPTLTVALRGSFVAELELRTLAGPKHSGEYGGAAPDALTVLLHALASLHDEQGDVAVEGLRRESWTGAGPTEHEFRELAEVVDGLPLIGTGDLGSRVWMGPAITVIGIDVPSVDEAVNAVSPYARAKLSVRLHPGQDAAEAIEALRAHFESVRPFGIGLEFSAGGAGNGFAADTSGPAFGAVCEAMAAAWGAETETAAAGGSIPLVSALSLAVPDAELLLLGTADGYSNIHAPNERVLLSEFERSTTAIADFFARFAASAAG